MTRRVTAALSAMPVALATIGLTACTAQMDDDAPLAEAPPARIVGSPVRCIETDAIDRTRVHNDRTIDFDLRAGRFVRNTLPDRCPGLGLERRFAYDASTGRLCRGEGITVLGQGAPRIRCALGDFVPVELVPEAG